MSLFCPSLTSASLGCQLCSRPGNTRVFRVTFRGSNDFIPRRAIPGPLSWRTARGLLPGDFDKGMTKCLQVGYNILLHSYALGHGSSAENWKSLALWRQSWGFRTTSIFLPASKTDSGARGVTRSLDCLCGVCDICPIHLLGRYVVALENRFVHSKQMPWSRLPLFPIELMEAPCLKRPLWLCLNEWFRLMEDGRKTT